MVSRKEDRTKWCLPGGKVDAVDWPDWHTSNAAAVASVLGALRELREETGLIAYGANAERVLGTGDYADGHANRRFVTAYLVKKWTGEFGTKEPIDIKWDYPAEVIRGPFGDFYRHLFDTLKFHENHGV